MNLRARGFTLVEVVLVLCLVGILTSLATPALSAGRDGAAVRAARDQVAAALTYTRAAALARGGAALVVDVERANLWVRDAAGDTVARPLDLRARYGVAVTTRGGPTVEIRYDAMGIGRLASRTLRFRRGRARAVLTVSAYGRVRAW